MKKTVVLLLALCVLLGTISCADREKTVLPNSTPVGDAEPVEEPDFPAVAEVRNPAAKGARVPFKRLESEGVFLCSENGLGAMVLIRSVEELATVKKSNVLGFTTAETERAFYTLVSQKSFEVYQILIIGTPRNDNSDACFGDRVVDELIIAENTGLPTAVYECSHSSHGTANDGFDAMPDRQQDVTVLLTRKADLDLSIYTETVNRGPNKYLCYNGIPDAEPLYGIW